VVDIIRADRYDSLTAEFCGVGNPSWVLP
jgi:hypothetical protein